MSPPASADSEEIKKILASYPEKEKSSLVNLLHDIQANFRYLPEEALRMVADHLGMRPAGVYEVATFYEGFHLKPRGEKICTVCMGTACHVRGAPRLLEQIQRDLDVQAGQTTKDLKFTLQTVNCVGACALGPLVIVNEEYHGHMTPSRLSKLTGTSSKKPKDTNP